MVCIIDDREDVWQGCGNLVQVKPYHFFRHTGDINAPPGLEKGDSPRSVESTHRPYANDSLTKADSKNGVSESLSELEQPDDSPREAEPEKLEQDEKRDEESEKAEEIERTEAQEEDTKADAKENADPSEARSDATSKDDTSGKEATEIAPEVALERELPRLESNIIDEDDDDYLLYLEDILRRIHTEFYATLDQGNGRKPLRTIIPRVRSQVLKGLCLTFSGLIPTHQKLHQSRAYKVARAFGAEVTQVGQIVLVRFRLPSPSFF